MNRLLNNSLAAFAAIVIAISSLGAITIVPTQQGIAIAAPALA